MSLNKKYFLIMPAIVAAVILITTVSTLGLVTVQGDPISIPYGTMIL